MSNHYGRPSQLKIEVSRSGCKTVLSDVFFTPPFKIAKPFYDAETMKLCVMNTSAGMLEGDRYELDIVVGPRCQLEVYTQSYTKIHKMSKNCAWQTCRISIAEGAVLKYLPQPAIPFAGSSFYGKTQVYMQRGSTLVLSDVLSCGRYKRGEVFEFRNYRARTEIFYDEKLVYVDNVILAPNNQDLSDMGFYEGYTHHAALMIFKEKIDERMEDDVYSSIEQFPAIDFGVTRVGEHGIIARMLGNSAEQLRNAIASASAG